MRYIYEFISYVNMKVIHMCVFKARQGLMHRYLIDERAVEKIQARGCCLGKYRVLINKSYYCFLEGIYECRNQDRRFVKMVNDDMLVCKTNNQNPCSACELYLETLPAEPRK